MNEIQSIKSKIRNLYETQPNIHMSVAFARPKAVIENIDATIFGVYKNIFRVEVTKDGEHHKYTLQYTDVLTGRVEIAELNGTNS